VGTLNEIVFVFPTVGPRSARARGVLAVGITVLCSVLTFGHHGGRMAVVGGAPPVAVVLLACLVVQVGFGGYGIGAFRRGVLMGGG
jgi:lipopolysaccharide export LptBFGC system permease protein LptF